MVCGVRKQLTNSGAAAGTDLDSIFKPRTSAAGANVNIRCTSGTPNQDLAQRFEPRGTSPKVADVGYRTPGGVDISNTFMDLNYNPSTGIPGMGGAYISSTSAPTAASLTLRIDSDGTWIVYKQGQSSTPYVPNGSGNWLTAAGGGAASNYAVRFTPVVMSGSPVIANDAAAFQTISVDRQIRVSSGSVDAIHVVQFDVEIRRVSDSVVVLTSSDIDFEVESLNS
jgi:hypothetical protein